MKNAGAIVLAAAFGLGLAHAQSIPGPLPLPRAHAHNDYEHTRPLFDALDRGFCSVEADIYLVDGQLLVAHDRDKVTPQRTLQALYLDPLAARIRENGGRVYPGGPTEILLIDVKSDGDATYLVLRDVLRHYTNILTRFSKDDMETKGVTAIISGNRPGRIIAEERVRFAALDGRPVDLIAGPPRELVPLISEDWKHLFKWRGVGEFPIEERQQLRDLVSKAHSQERKVRFWGTPDNPEIWQQLYDAHVDLLNADDLAGLRKFLLKAEASPLH
jgi:hypothetical protein